ncbi:MAG: YbjN domain-containing protein [Anaerolineales bacterium]
MPSVFEAVREFLERDGWPVTAIDGNSGLRTGFKGDNSEWACYAQVREEQNQFLFYSICPVSAPAEKRMTIAEFITRANYGMILGAFEMDFADGEIRYRTAVGVDGGEVTAALIRPAVYANVLTMDAYLPGIMNILYGDDSPDQAIKAVEGA